MSYKRIIDKRTPPVDPNPMTMEGWPAEVIATDPGIDADPDERRAWYKYASETLLPLLGVPASPPFPDTDLGKGNRPASHHTDWRYNVTPTEDPWATPAPASENGVVVNPAYSFQSPGDVPFPK